LAALRIFFAPLRHTKPKQTGKGIACYADTKGRYRNIPAPAVGGKKESEGPLAQGFDELVQDAGFDAEGCTGWEQAESMLQQRCARHCLRKAGIAKQQVELAFAGDLQAQCTASNYTMRQLGVPFAGLYGACSTMAEALCLAAFCAAAGYAHEILAMSSSHFCAAERQFRTPLEYGGKRTPTAQWTATAAGACLVRGSGAAGVPVLSATIGRVCDAGVKDINNMGAAMAPRRHKRCCTTLRTPAPPSRTLTPFLPVIWVKLAVPCCMS